MCLCVFAVGCVQMSVVIDVFHPTATNTFTHFCFSSSFRINFRPLLSKLIKRYRIEPEINTKAESQRRSRKTKIYSLNSDAVCCSVVESGGSDGNEWKICFGKHKTLSWCYFPNGRTGRQLTNYSSVALSAIIAYCARDHSDVWRLMASLLLSTRRAQIVIVI